MPLFDWKNIALAPDASIKEALKVLDTQAMQIVLVVNDQGRLLGTLTDGDVRRGLLSDKTLSSPVEEVMNKTPLYGLESENDVAWRKKMQEKGLRHLPILDLEHHVVSLFYLKQSAARSLDNPVVIMLGGLGMRLRPLTETVPKPMLKVGGKPILETILNHAAEQGFTNFHFCINYLGDQIRSYFGNGERWGVNIDYVQEPQRLGTAGALSLLEGQLEQDFIVMNGDLLTKVDLRALLNFHHEHENRVTACVREYSQQVPYGVLELEKEQVAQIVEKPVYRYFVNAGIYAMSPESICHIPKKSFYDMPSLMEDMIAKQYRVGGFPLTDYWMDIGKMPDFEKAQVDYDVHFTKLHD